MGYLKWLAGNLGRLYKRPEKAESIKPVEMVTRVSDDPALFSSAVADLYAQAYKMAIRNGDGEYPGIIDWRV